MEEFNLLLSRKKISTLSSIDRKDIKLIFNPRGTNEIFVKNNIRRAKLLVHSKNHNVLDEINERADVMITDLVEVAYQVKKHRGVLCTGKTANYTNGEIAILMQRDLVLKEYINTLMHLLKLSVALEEF